MKAIIVAGITVVACSSVLAGPLWGIAEAQRNTAAADSGRVTMGTDSIKLTVIYDNNPGHKDLSTAWGFACLIEGFPETILFDTGGEGRILLANMAALGISPDSIDVIVISHAHRDHFGGLEALLEKCNSARVFMLRSFPEGVKKLAIDGGAELVEVIDPVDLLPGVRSTGEMRLGPGPREQALILTIQKGLVVITGCAHPGIVAIVQRAKEMTGQDALLLIGGFHLLQKSERATRATITKLEDLGVGYVAPGHCSGDAARRICEELFEDRYINCAVGEVISTTALNQDKHSKSSSGN